MAAELDALDGLRIYPGAGPVFDVLIYSDVRK